MKTVLSGNALWSFDFEIQNRNKNEDFLFHFSGVKPFHNHSGEIFLSEGSIRIVGDDVFEVQFKDLTQLYLGFDEIYTPSLSKNFGMFWQPLRLTLYDEKLLYLIIDYNFVGAKNKLWFNKLMELLS
ncbi:MAG: hypothetical protein V4663_17900 [Bacteroidota bacterium]